MRRPHRKDAARVSFVERLSLRHMVNVFGAYDHIYYLEESYMVRLVRKIFSSFERKNYRRLWLGSINDASGIRKVAYHAAKYYAREFNRESYDIIALDKINQRLIFEKAVFQKHYEYFEFILIIKQYIKEKNDLEYDIDLKNDKIDVSVTGEKLQRGEYADTPYLCSAAQFSTALSILLFAAYHTIRRLRFREKPRFDRVVMCVADDLPTSRMFTRLFTGLALPKVLASAAVLHQLPPGIDAERQIKLIEFRQVRELVAIAWQYCSLVASVRQMPGVLRTVIFELTRYYAYSYASLPKISNSTLFVFEHLSIENAIRNELLRIQGNKVIFMPLNTYAIDHYFPGEYKYNYDILCSSGKALEKVYQMQQAQVAVILKVGPYSPNVGVDHSPAAEHRRRSLHHFKNERTVVTFVSTGLSSWTMSAEVGLMGIARAVAQRFDVCVMVRCKPGLATEETTRFYEGNFEGLENVIVTTDEYDLYDFLTVTDLFVTGTSSAGIDLCVAGGNMYSIDVWNDQDMYLWQSFVPGVLVRNDEAVCQIGKWISNEKAEREVHKGRMTKLREFVAYSYGSFDEYVANFHQTVAPYLPSSERLN